MAKTKWPFGGFFLKLLDEKEGTHRYEDYQKELAEKPVTEEAEKEHRESMQAVNAELERLDAEAEQRRRDEERQRRARELSEPPFDSDLFIQLSDCPQNEDVVPAEKVAALEQETTLVVAESKQYVSDLIGESYKHWENGRVILDCGTGRGKNEFIVRRLAGWLVDRTLNGGGKDSILYLCPLNSLHAEMIRRRLKAEIDDMGEEAAAELRLYEDVLKVQTYQYMEKCCRNNSGKLEEYLQGSKYIVADECHYFTDFATYNINTCLSMEELQRTEKDHVVIYMSATGGQIYEMLNAVSQTPSDRIYTLPQDYRHITQMYFYARENLVMMLKDLPTDEKAVVFVSSGEDLVRMKEQFGDAAGYYCSENNPKYGKQFDALENCIRDRKLQKRFVFTTKAIGMGIEIKDRTVKHIFIDQWKPTDIAQSMDRKRPLDAEDTCTVYFRDYDADWYMGGLKKYLSIIEEELKPVEAFLAGEEAFAEYRHSDTPDRIQKKLTDSKIMEWDASENTYRVNPLGVKQLRYEREMLDKMTRESYLKYFVDYAQTDLRRGVQRYRMEVLTDWIKMHLNQPMAKEDMYADIMLSKVFTEYRNRPMGQTVLNEKLKIYGVKIVSIRDKKRVKDGERNNSRDATFWKLVEI